MSVAMGHQISRGAAMSRWTPPEGQMHPADIVAALRKSGSGVTHVARALGVAAPSVSRTVSGRDTSRRIATEISRTTGIPISTIWPGRYDRPARPRRRAA